ncbi:MAG: DUF4153 domain-containing protein [Sphingobacteriales bacterium]|nr:MAG: DUF4153 domain-containing protein [Sphingobacteriales bacterium]
MKLLSAHYLLRQAGRSFRRFPLALLSAATATVLAIILVETEDEPSNKFPFINAMLCAALGISLYFCAAVYAEKRKIGATAKNLLRLLVTVLLVALYFSLPGSETTHNTSLPYIRFAIYSITSHLLVAFLPFVADKNENGFWNYNKLLFIRFWTAALYSAVLYIGLACAIGALRLLFDVDVPDRLLFEIFICIAGVFSTWFFLSGIPTDLQQLNHDTSYPRGLKIFAQYMLLPLLVLYLAILYVYGGKIVLLWDWPRGIVSYLIMCVSVLGILTLLLLHPYGHAARNTWIKRFTKAYYVILIPLLALLFIAIGMRLSDYGITINRYIILLTGVWLAIVCLYFVAGKTNIKFIPVSLAVMLLLMSFGPWGMFSLSEKSQVNRLETILLEAKILSPEHKINHETIWVTDSLLTDSLPTFYSLNPQLNENILNDSLHNEVMSILDYLDDHHGFASIRGWYKQDVDSLVQLANRKVKKRWYRKDEGEIYMRTLGLKHEYRQTDKNADTYFSFNAMQPDVTDIRGYDYMTTFDLSEYRKEDRSRTFSIDSVTYTLSYSFKLTDSLNLTYGQTRASFNIAQLLSKIIAERAREKEQLLSLPQMSLYKSTADFDIKIELHSASLEGTGDTVKVNSLGGAIFFKKK